jgi:alpha-D-ribose 1-methylphosphonate 5-triphosphate synthase subunit PhnH
MKNVYDIEQANRNNFRSSLEALARPGELQTVTPLFGSGLLAMASVLLYAEVSYFYRGTLNFELIQALCGARNTSQENADYLFFDSLDHKHLVQAKTGTAESPEQGATILFSCPDFDGDSTRVKLSGPGIDGTKQLCLPVMTAFLDELSEKNELFPMGIDLFLVSQQNTLLGLPRTTRIEVII